MSIFDSERKRREREARAEAWAQRIHEACAATFEAAGDTESALGPIERQTPTTRYHRTPDGLLAVHAAYVDGRHGVSLIDDSGPWRELGRSMGRDFAAVVRQAKGGEA